MTRRDRGTGHALPELDDYRRAAAFISHYRRGDREGLVAIWNEVAADVERVLPFAMCLASIAVIARGTVQELEQLLEHAALYGALRGGS